SENQTHGNKNCTDSLSPPLVSNQEDESEWDKDQRDVLDQSGCNEERQTPHGLILQQEIRSKYDEKRNNDVVVRDHEIVQHDEQIPSVQVQNRFSISFRQPFAGFPQEQGCACMHQKVQAVEKEQRPRNSLFLSTRAHVQVAQKGNP